MPQYKTKDLCVCGGGLCCFPSPVFMNMRVSFFVCVLFGFVTGVTSMPCPIRMVCVGYCDMDSGSVSQTVRLVSHECPESS